MRASVTDTKSTTAELGSRACTEAIPLAISSTTSEFSPIFVPLSSLTSPFTHSPAACKLSLPTLLAPPSVPGLKTGGLGEGLHTHPSLHLSFPPIDSEVLPISFPSHSDVYMPPSPSTALPTSLAALYFPFCTARTVASILSLLAPCSFPMSSSRSDGMDINDTGENGSSDTFTSVVSSSTTLFSKNGPLTVSVSYSPPSPQIFRSFCR
mmetsp:Transcript_27152/g.69973  ORF Transcript_27152/g.69973 Transcript_27152/m.69973 type:complete len:209 (-) Transcript_27152:730-1356(-)